MSTKIATLPPLTGKASAGAPEPPPTGSPTARLIAPQNEAPGRYKPDLKKDETYCNEATCWIAERMGAPRDPLVTAAGKPYSANDIARNLAVSTRYRDVSSEQAQALANHGLLVIGAYYKPAGHGHVVTVRPEGVPGDQPVGHSGPLLNDIGERDRIARQSGAFGSADQVYYYTPASGGHD